MKTLYLMVFVVSKYACGRMIAHKGWNI